MQLRIVPYYSYCQTKQLVVQLFYLWMCSTHFSMDALNRLKALASQMDFEPAEDHGCPKLDRSKVNPGFVHNAVMPNGKTIPLLKTLLTSACERDCYYCPFRAGRNFRRATLKPDEMAGVFKSMHKAGIVEGLFLSSGIIGGAVRTQDKLLASAEILRENLGFKGYLHLKIMPGAEQDQIERAMQLANRVSINLEAPNTNRLNILAPHKQFIDELLEPLRVIERIRKNNPGFNGWNHRWPSVATQFVVGGAGENDLELLSTTEYLYGNLNLKRAYYSPFRPVKDTPLENLPPTKLQRESRLYQASFLIRDYGFSVEELPFNDDGNLPQGADPKRAWAEINLRDNPIEINNAGRRELLHVPGIGPQGVKAILAARKGNCVNNLEDLRKIGINPARIAPFVLLNGRRPSQQLLLL
jgi:predicted DNA-binding helix-hairpin-helix protein